MSGIKDYAITLVHGNWATWGVWSECTTTCGPDGMRERNRTCTDPDPLHGGDDCDDTINGDVEAETCNSEIVCPGIIFSKGTCLFNVQYFKSYSCLILFRII